MTHRGTGVVLLTGVVMPAALAYGSLLDALGDEFDTVPKDLELYAGDAPPPGYSVEIEIDGVLRAAEEAGFERFPLFADPSNGQPVKDSGPKRPHATKTAIAK